MKLPGCFSSAAAATEATQMPLTTKPITTHYENLINVKTSWNVHQVPHHIIILLRRKLNCMGCEAGKGTLLLCDTKHACSLIQGFIGQ